MPSAFETYTRDIDIDPTGTYFVVVTTGGTPPDRLCDSASRWETEAVGTNLQPTWINYTGGDTLWSVAITGVAVYVGGHQRWLNNTGGSNAAAPGAVSREGLAALDPLNGLPYSWNPTRTRGVGVFDLTSVPGGLLMGSDTDRVGRLRVPRPPRPVPPQRRRRRARVRDRGPARSLDLDRDIDIGLGHGPQLRRRGDWADQPACRRHRLEEPARRHHDQREAVPRRVRWVLVRCGPGTALRSVRPPSFPQTA